VERFKQISEAYRVLSDSGQRALVDDYLEQRTFRRASLRGEDSFVDRLAGE
jgi:DnaJ-class molecular chaperone